MSTLALRMMCVLMLLTVTGWSFAAQTDTADKDTVKIELPLQDGKLHVRDLLSRLCREMGVAVPQAVSQMTWTIDVRSTVGRVQLHVLDKLADGAFATSVQGDKVILTIDNAVLCQRLSDASLKVTNWLADITGGVGDHEPAVFGLTIFTDANPRTPLAEAGDLPGNVVVLVHGLDDPGFMWRDLIPALRQEGFVVGRFEYPNDGPVSDSADMLANALMDLRGRGVGSVDIVAHSMGGLVSRDVLTRAAYYDSDGSGNARLPAVDHLIMLGTPNHGSHMARLRGVAEIREHVYRAFKGDVPAFSFGDDGSGEAAIDLLPDSDFLRRLNDRPLPQHTQITIVAAKWSPFDETDVSDLVSKVQRFSQSSSAPQWLRDLAAAPGGGGDSAAAVVSDIVKGLGDGCVSLESTQIEGVEDFEIVRGNHLSMIVNIMNSERIPPAVPIVVDRLTREHQQ